MGFGFLGGFRVNLHRGADVLVTHDVLNDLQAVSYTHLDVYKRQALLLQDPAARLYACGGSSGSVAVRGNVEQLL